MTQRRNQHTTEWRPEHDARLRELHAKGYSFRVIAELLNEEFATGFTDDACRHKTERLGLPTNGEFRERPALTERRQETFVVPLQRDGTRIVIVNDLQTPYHHVDALRAIERFCTDFEPNWIFNLGDHFDFYLMSDFNKAPSRGNNLQDELDVGRAQIERQERWAPKAKKVFVCGNHEWRLWRWLWAHGPMLAFLRSLDPTELLGLGDWKVLQWGSHVDFMDTILEHGDAALKAAGATARHMIAKRGSSGISGHTHRLADINHTDARREYRWIENGCLCLTQEYVHKPDWQHAFTYGIVKSGKLYLFPTKIVDSEFRAEGRWYRGT